MFPAFKTSNFAVQIAPNYNFLSVYILTACDNSAGRIHKHDNVATRMTASQVYDAPVQ